LTGSVFVQHGVAICSMFTIILCSLWRTYEKLERNSSFDFYD